MCGIAGFFGSDSFPRDIKKASELIAHRGPDGDGYEKSVARMNEGQCFSIELAHRRLAIVDLTEQGRQPFRDDKGRCLVFNGEILNWKTIRKELQANGYEFKSHTDTEVILLGYDLWGEKVFERLNGFWALALYDPFNKDGPSLVLSRDRCGIKPLYYSIVSEGDNHAVYFASEIRSLISLANKSSVIIPQKVVEFLVNGFVAADGETIYESVQEFPIASFAVVDLNSGKLLPERYWTPRKIGEKVSDEEKAVDRFSEILEDAVDNWMQADVPVGLTLSSGIDSSVIAVAANRRGYRDVAAFSSHFPNSPLDEFEMAAELAKRLGMRHIAVTPDFNDLEQEVSRFALHQEMMFTSFSQFVSWCVLREIKKEGYKVFLSGQGGDELFLGYQRYLSSYIRSNQNHESTISKFLNTKKNTELSWFKLVSYLAYFGGQGIRGFRAKSRAESIFKSHYVAPSLGKSLQATPSELDKLQISETLGVSQLRRLLRFDDRSASAFGLEGRPVLLDQRLIEFAFNLDPQLLIKNGWTKYILRKYLERHGHGDIAWRRKKLGFPAPDLAWSDRWLKSGWQEANKQRVVSEIIREDLSVSDLTPWQKLTLSVVSLTAREMQWR